MLLFVVLLQAKEMLAIEMGEYYKGGARAQVVQKVEKQLFDLYKNPELNVKPKELEQRGGAYYSDAACEVINAIYNDKQTEHYVNIPHHGHVENIPADWAVEMTCILGRNGATPHPRITRFDEKVLGLIHTIKGFEVAASNAALSGNFNDVLLALNLSPLVHSDRDAEVRRVNSFWRMKNGCLILPLASKRLKVSTTDRGRLWNAC